MDYFKVLTIILSAIISTIVSLGLFNYKERQKSKIEFQKKRKSVLDKYREFICVSAYELQRRINNIMVGGLFYYADSSNESYSNNVRYYTMFLVSQFFAWKEILRKEMHYLDFSEGKEEIRILENLESLETLFSSDRVGDEMFMIFRGEQRAIGECMIVYNEETSTYECIGYSKFIELLENEKCKNWFKILIEKMDKAIAEYEKYNEFNSKRLLKIHDKLIDLLNTLDPDLKRFPNHREKINNASLQGVKIH